MDSELTGAVIGAVAALIVGVASFIGTIYNASRQRRQDREATKAAIIAEVSALASIIEKRMYRESLEAVAMEVEATNEACSLHVPVPAHYCRVYEANVSSIGLMPAEQAKQVVRFYQLIDSVIADVSKGGAIAGGTNDPNAFRIARDFLNEAVVLAATIEGGPAGS